MSKTKKVNEALNMENAAEMFETAKNAQTALIEMTTKVVAEDVAEAQAQSKKAVELVKNYTYKVVETKTVTDLYELNTEAMKNFGNMFMDSLHAAQSKMTTRAEKVMNTIKQ